MVEADRHSNIEILTYTEVESVEGEPGDFTVTLKKKPRYIIEDNCTGCTTCVEYCPAMVPDPYNQELSTNKAVHIYFSLAVPLITYIDENCLYLKEKKCRICEAVCENGAIDFNQEPEKREVKVGAIVLSPGFETFDPGLKGDYGYGKMQNVVTSLDFERLLSSTGPYEGEIRRPSDGRHPRKIAWIQCVGSRRVTPGDNTYCSAVCCTYTQKQVILAKEHDADMEATVFHNDIRSYGKDFERYYQRTEDLSGVRFIRSYVSVGKEIPETGNVTIRYSTPDEGVKEEEFDLVVLSVGLNPPADAEGLAEKFGIELESHGFCKTDPFDPLETTRPGIFVSGAFQGPADIPESVFTASGAGSRCGELLDYRRGKLVKEKEYPPEKDVRGEEPRVGVFVCHCGANIGRVVDVPSVVEYASSLPGVVHAQEQLFSCTTNSAKEITDMVREKGLNRVVIAACSPRTLEPLFQDTLREAGVNQYLLEMANIREHCSWVHAREKEDATDKAKDLVRMSVARGAVLEPLRQIELPVNKAALVIGGGMAGMTCALSIASQGHEVHLLEKSSDLGGMARRLHYTLDGRDVQARLRDLVREVYRHPSIHVYTDATITEATGYVGNFVTKVRSERGLSEIKHGAAVIAIGADEYKPVEYLYGENDRVLTQLELEEKIARGEEDLTGSQTLVMIQCVGCRQEDRDYCSRVCCSQAVKNALKLKGINPGMDIYILFRDMRTYGFQEDYYREASERDVKFIRYEPDDKPRVEAVEEGGRPVLRVSVTDPILGQKLAVDADYLALAAAVLPPAGNSEIAQFFKVSLGPDGFFKEAHVKLRPVEFPTEGVFLCGTAHYPKHMDEAINQAHGAASRVLTLLSHDTVTASGSICEVDEKKCMGCGACVSVCAYGAIEFRETRQGKKAVVNPVICKGDGLCNAMCPTGAISLKHFTDEELLSQIDAAVGDV
ncbi:MAG: heterodisulfide reductase [Deltaproteobacteria bacterium]|nr:MAG: heterodisulfide reductase [Deltaproteobacteria bacterium]